MFSFHILRFSRRLYRWVFPETIQRTADVNQLLEKLYPTINWDKVRFHKGMPWFMVGNFAHAIVLPATWHYQRIHAYFSQYDTHTSRGLSTVVHESFHVLQYQDTGRGIGLLRGFLVYYLADYFQLLFKYGFKKSWMTANDLAYREHPMEIPAHMQDDEFCSFCIRQQTNLSISDIPEHFIKTHCGYQPKQAFPFLLLAIFTVLIFSIIKPLIEILFLMVAAPMWVLGRICLLVKL